MVLRNRLIVRRNAILIALILIVGTQFLSIIQVDATPVSPIGTATQAAPFESNPTVGTSSGIGTVTGAISNAYDGDWDTQCNFKYGFGDGYLEFSGFNSVSTPFEIWWVDFKVSYKATGTTGVSDEKYRIVYYVGDSPTGDNTVVLQDWVSGGAAKFNHNGMQSNQAWSRQDEPNDFTWDWTDIGNVKVRIETDQVTTNHLQTFTLYEVWLSIYPAPLPPTGLSVQPSFVNVSAGEVFFVDVYIADALFLWGYQFEIRYNTAILTASEFYTYSPFTEQYPSGIEDDPWSNGTGRVYVAFSAFLGDNVGFTGNTPVNRVYFQVDAQGESSLHLTQVFLADASGAQVIVDQADGRFDNRATPAAAPVAAFSWTPASPSAGETVTFDASGSVDSDGTIVSYSWKFGDGQTGTGVTTTHAYSAGTYSVNLTVTDNDGLNGTTEKTLTVGVLPPSAQFTYTPLSPVENEEITFDASKSSSFKGTQIVTYRWNFGDGAIWAGASSRITHKYRNAGSYIVNLTVTDNASPPLSGSITKSVVVGRGSIVIEADVGTIHFVGEKAEFYLLVKFLGKPVSIGVYNIKAKLYYNGNMIADLSEEVTRVDEGLYRICWDPIPLTARPGTYTALIQASYYALKASTIRSFLISKTLTKWNPLLISINRTVGTLKMDIGLIKVQLDVINAKLVSIDGNVATINSTIGLIQTDTGTINAKIIDLEDTVVTIQTDLGTITTDMDSIQLKITSINGTAVTIRTGLGTMSGKITTLQGDTATIKTDIGTMRTALKGLTGATVSSIATPTGNFNLLALTTSTMQSMTFADNTLTITVNGPTGTTGILNVVIPKQFLTGIQSTIEKIATTINDKLTVFTYTEDTETYVLSLSYTHSTDTIRIFLAGIQSQPLPPLTTILMIIAAIGVATAMMTIYMKRLRKKTIKP
jgi:PKD repeat protein